MQDWAGLMFVLGGAPSGSCIPVLAGFIAYAIADRPGLVPGFVGLGSASLPTVWRACSAPGFLGAIVAGLIGGVIARGCAI